MARSGKSALRASAAAVAIAMLACMSPTLAQVFKCVDRAGHTTYQQSPCTGGQQGGAVELKEPVTVRQDGNDALWGAAAREQRVVVGMPKTFVTQALGTPAQIRAPRNGESGSEVWVYNRNGQTTRVGFINNAIAWLRSDAAAGTDVRGAASTNAPNAQGAANDREARIREALVVGKTCTAALQDAGNPDREEPLVAGNTTGARYIYTFDAGNANAFAAFVCLNGRVTSVERYVPGTQ
jgi:hypothetical protein